MSDQTTIQAGDRVRHPDDPPGLRPYVVERLEHDDGVGDVAVFADGRGFWRCSGLVKVEEAEHGKQS